MLKKNQNKWNLGKNDREKRPREKMAEGTKGRGNNG